jgi:hypothetical protein
MILGERCQECESVVTEEWFAPAPQKKAVAAPQGNLVERIEAGAVEVVEMEDPRTPHEVAEDEAQEEWREELNSALHWIIKDSEEAQAQKKAVAAPQKKAVAAPQKKAVESALRKMDTARVCSLQAQAELAEEQKEKEHQRTEKLRNSNSYYDEFWDTHRNPRPGQIRIRPRTPEKLAPLIRTAQVGVSYAERAEQVARTNYNRRRTTQALEYARDGLNQLYAERRAFASWSS